MMKNISCILFVMVGFGFVLTSCQSKQKLKEDGIASSIMTFEVQEDCYTPRKIILTINEKQVNVKKIADQWIYESIDGQKRYLPCEVPEIFKKEETQLIISGTTLEIFIGERWVGTPFRASTIKPYNNP